MGMIGRCPTVDIVMNGRKVGGLIDTGSEVTTVTEVDGGKSAEL